MATSDPNVQGIITSQQGYVTNWVSQAQSFIDQIASLAAADLELTTADGLEFGVTDISGDLTAQLKAAAPARPTFDALSLSSLPAAPAIDVPSVTTVDVPDFSGTAPTLDFGTVPSATLPVAPDAPGVSDPDSIDAPSLTVPTPPDFQPVAIPEGLTVELPVFDASAPEDTLVAPTATFEFAEQAYQSTLLDAAKAKLLFDLENGGYGIEPADEQALFERTRARTMDTMLGEVDQSLNLYASRGFPLEPGEARIAIDAAQQRAHDALADANRTITLERSRLYVENRQFTLREARELETVLLQYHTALMERTLRAAQAALEAGIAIFNAQVAKYNAQLAAYQAEAQVFEAKIRAQAGKLEIYRLEMQAAGLQQDQQRVAVEVYRARLAALQSLVDLYRGRLEAANIKAGIDRTRLEAYRARVDAFGQLVQAKTAEFGMYEARVRGQSARVDAFRAEVEAYRSRVEASRAAAEAQTANLNAVTERSRVQLAAYQASVEAFRANIDGQFRKIEAQSEVYRADVAAYGAITEAVKAGYLTRIQELDSNARWNIGVQEAKTHIAIANLEKLKATAEIRLSASKFGAEFYKSVVSATLGSINTLASIVQNV